jgi:hypothetical protein
MEIEKRHCAFGLPEPAPSTGQWVVYGTRALQCVAVRALSVHGTRSPCHGMASACGVVRSPMA